MTKPGLQAVDPNTPTTPTPDPFDLASLRLNPSFLETAGVKKLLTTVPARRPSAQDFVRVHSSPEYRENFAMIDLKDDREDFLVRPELLPELAGEVVYKTIFTTINRQGVCFLWPIRLPAPDDRKSDWARSAREAARHIRAQIASPWRPGRGRHDTSCQLVSIMLEAVAQRSRIQHPCTMAS